MMCNIKQQIPHLNRLELPLPEALHDKLNLLYAWHHKQEVVEPSCTASSMYVSVCDHLAPQVC